MESDVKFLLDVAERLEYLKGEPPSWPKRLRRIARKLDKPTQEAMEKASVDCEKQKVHALKFIRAASICDSQADVYDVAHIIDCPVCGKDMTFQVSGRNGHIKISCEGPCPDWIE